MRHVDFDRRRWHVGDHLVDRLVPGEAGVWLIETRGSQHFWDLGRRVFTREPRSPHASSMPFDRTTQRIGRIQVQPEVGGRLWIWFDDPDEIPALTEHYRISSLITAIRRLEECSCP